MTPGAGLEDKAIITGVSALKSANHRGRSEGPPTLPRPPRSDHTYYYGITGTRQGDPAARLVVRDLSMRMRQ
jgi:hypothetical protein